MNDNIKLSFYGEDSVSFWSDDGFYYLSIPRRLIDKAYEDSAEKGVNKDSES